MNKNIGLWIDHRKAVIVIVTEQGEELKKITSNMEKHIRFTGGIASEDGSTEDVRDRQFGNHLNTYYDEVISTRCSPHSLWRWDWRLNFCPLLSASPWLTARNRWRNAM